MDFAACRLSRGLRLPCSGGMIFASFAAKKFIS
jgi:hypothetical protein